MKEVVFEWKIKGIGTGYVSKPARQGWIACKTGISAFQARLDLLKIQY